MKHHTKRRPFLPVGAVALCAWLALAGAASAQTVVLSAEANSNLTTITITGTGLQPVSGPPKVLLDSTALSVSIFSSLQITAKLPAGLKAGTYDLAVTGSSGTANFDVTIGSVGPQGPAGPAGATGPKGATGSQGPPGTITLPYYASGSTSGGVLFEISAASGVGIVGQSGDSDGLQGYGGIESNGVYGVGGGGCGTSSCTHFSGAGGLFQGGGTRGDGLNGGDGVDAYPGSDDGVGIVATSGGITGGPNWVAGDFLGDVEVLGNISKSGGSFKIDDPIDPGNKYLYHSFVESPDMMNIYNGNVTTDGGGMAVVKLPSWFEALNGDFRYQLTTIGQFAQAMVFSKIMNNSFTIKTDKPNIEVSWQVTGIRQDAWANAHRIPTEVDKAADEQGHYLHPELYGHTDEPSIGEIRHPRPKPHQRPAH